MTCESIRAELIGYCFGTLDELPRASVEAHLPGCAACVRAFVELKRAIELGEAAPRPSEISRARLRQAVAEELGLAGPARRPRRERSLALALAAGLVLVAGFATRQLSLRPGSPPLATLPTRR